MRLNPLAPLLMKNRKLCCNSLPAHHPIECTGSRDCTFLASTVTGFWEQTRMDRFAFHRGPICRAVSL